MGVGIGPYLVLLLSIVRKAPTRPIMCIDIPCVSMRTGLEGTCFTKVADSVATCCSQLGWDHVAIAAHSYGTFVTSKICKRYPELVKGMCIMDPVCIMTCYPQLIKNFIYEGFGESHPDLETKLKHWMRVIASRDYLIADTFGRKFRWQEL